MGSRAALITRKDLLSHPAFKDVPQTSDPTARVGGARIELVRFGNETRLGSCYQQIPLRVLPSFWFETEPAALLYLITLTTGLLDGDGHLFEINARAGTTAFVTGQSASRIHPALASFASQQWVVAVEDDACLVILPGPNIPFKNSRFLQRGRVELAPTARMIWGDIWLAGRYERGELSERFQFERIVQDFEVRRDNKLVYRDCFRWDGPMNSEEKAWFFHDHLACGSLFVTGPLPEKLPAPSAGLHRAIFPLESGDHCLRFAGPPNLVSKDLVKVALTIAGSWTGGKNAPPWFLQSNELSPNHWFSSSD